MCVCRHSFYLHLVVLVVILVVAFQVSDPQHHGEGRTKHTSYLVEVRSAERFAMCRRRYSDFQWLYKRLLEERAGAIIPIIPHRTAMTSKVRFSEELVNDRQVVLHYFLRQVLEHPELKGSNCLNTFLTADFTTWEQIRKTGGDGNNVEEGTSVIESGVEDVGLDDKDDTGTPKVSAGKSGFSGFMGNLVSKAKIAMGGNVEMEPTDDDDLFEELEVYANQMDTNVKILAKEAPAFVAASKAKADGMEKMAASWAAMGQYRINPNNDVIVKTSSAELFASLSQHFTGFCRLQHSLYQKETETFEKPILELARDVQALKIALTQRRDALIEYSRKANLGKTKMKKLDKMKESEFSTPDQVHCLELELTAAKEDGMALWKVMDIISKRLQRDIERFRVQVHQKLQNAMQQYCDTGGEFSQKQLDEYRKMAGTVGLPGASKGDGNDDAGKEEPEAPVTASL